MSHWSKYRRHYKKKTAWNLEKHAIRRASSRCNMDLTHSEIQQLNKQITNRIACRLEKYSINRGLWKIILPNGKPAFVVYDKKRASIVTFLTEQMVIAQQKVISQ